MWLPRRPLGRFARRPARSIADRSISGGRIRRQTAHRTGIGPKNSLTRANHRNDGPATQGGFRGKTASAACRLVWPAGKASTNRPDVR